VTAGLDEDDYQELLEAAARSEPAKDLGRFYVIARVLHDMNPDAVDTTSVGIEESPDAGEAMARAVLDGMPEANRVDLLDEIARFTGRRIRTAGGRLLTTFGAFRLDGDLLTPELIAVAAATSLGDED
jgi:hypothetical protein